MNSHLFGLLGDTKTAVSSRSPSSLEKRLALTLLTLMSGQRLMNLAKQTKSASSSLKAISFLMLTTKIPSQKSYRIFSDNSQHTLKSRQTVTVFTFTGNATHPDFPLKFLVFKGKPKLSSRYYVKNSEKGLEIYVGGLTNRYSTFTGNRISDTETITDCTVPLIRFL